MDMKLKFPLTREQQLWFVQVVLLSTIDRINSFLPDSLDWKDYKSNRDNTNGPLETAGMILGVFYAQQTDDGLGIGDALVCAGHFDEKCEQFLNNAWKGEGVRFKKYVEENAKPGVCMDDVYRPYGYPDIAFHAEQFVAQCFDQK